MLTLTQSESVLHSCSLWEFHLSWPAKSPNLSHIENLWVIKGKESSSCKSTNKSAKLCSCFAIPQVTIQKLINSIRGDAQSALMLGVNLLVFDAVAVDRVLQLI